MIILEIPPFPHQKGILRFEAFLPDGLDTVAEVIEDVATLDTTTGRQETTDNAGDVLSDVECLGIIHTDALHTETETADARKHHRLSLTKPVFKDVLKLRHHTDDRSFGKPTVTTSLLCDFAKCYLTLAHGLCKIFAIRAAALDVVLN